MNIVANLGVLDEVELIGPCIDHLRRIGIDQIVATDLGSVDGTRDILAAKAGPDFHLIQLERNEDPWGFPERMYRFTLDNFQADRVLFLDPDEFWLPRTGKLRDVSQLDTCEALQVDRYNAPLVLAATPPRHAIGPEDYDNIYLVTRPVEQARVRIDVELHLRWIDSRVARKMLVDPCKVSGVTVGSHRALDLPDRRTAVCRPDDLIIAHYPFTSWARFQRKLANIERSMEMFGDRLQADQAWHWRRWLSLAKTGRAQQEFEQQQMSEENFRKAVAQGIIQTAAQALAATVERA